MQNLQQELEKKLEASWHNNYGLENYNELRFGKYRPKPVSIKNRVKTIVKEIIRYKPQSKFIKARITQRIGVFLDPLQHIFENLNNEDKTLLIELLAYRMLGYKKVKLSRNNNDYWNAIENSKSLFDPNDTYDPNFIHYILYKFKLDAIGYDINFYYTPIGVTAGYILEQYAYKKEGQKLVSVQENDVVLDLGGCWGDTALYFASQAGENGKVFSFEFIPNNIKLFQKNISFNPKLASRIQLVEQPVLNISETEVYFKDHGPASKVKFEPFGEQSGRSKTISIDDFVNTNNIDKVDFIKMDIEGAEPLALEGAIETIKKFRPKLAIAIYHSMSDMATIPNWILDLNLDYEIFLGHYTIHAEETVCFAKPKVKHG